MTPYFFRYDRNPIYLNDLYAGATAFLICGGPSINTQPLHILGRRGLLTCTVNNVAAIVRSHLWVGVDPACRFAESIWRDPGVWKFVPSVRMEETIRTRDLDGNLCDSESTVFHNPAVAGIEIVDNFAAEKFLGEPGFCWGCGEGAIDSADNTGARSVMMVALKVLYVLGVRRVCLLGCDFRMRHGVNNYAFEQQRNRAAIRCNNHSYRVLNERFRMLRPHFEAEGFEVVNCTPNSGLHAFDQVPFEVAVEQALVHFPKSTNTDGMYDS